MIITKELQERLDNLEEEGMVELARQYRAWLEEHEQIVQPTPDWEVEQKHE